MPQKNTKKFHHLQDSPRNHHQQHPPTQTSHSQCRFSTPLRRLRLWKLLHCRRCSSNPRLPRGSPFAVSVPRPTPPRLRRCSVWSRSWVFSVLAKQPRRLKLCMEDLIRHNVATRARTLFNKEKREQEAAQLEAQYNKIVEACEELENTDPFLAYEGTKKRKGNRFTPELRVPTETPPTVVCRRPGRPSLHPKRNKIGALGSSHGAVDFCTLYS